MMTMGYRVRESLFYYGDTFEVILGIYVSDQRRTVVHHNVTSSLCVTCMWQWWARGIVRLGMGGLRHAATILSTAWCYRSFCITSVYMDNCNHCIRHSSVMCKLIYY